MTGALLFIVVATLGYSDELVASVWPLDLNIEFHETIKQGSFPVQTGVN
jgi:hypothetical protein